MQSVRGLEISLVAESAGLYVANGGFSTPVIYKCISYATQLMEPRHRAWSRLGSYPVNN